MIASSTRREKSEQVCESGDESARKTAEADRQADTLQKRSPGCRRPRREQAEKKM